MHLETNRLVDSENDDKCTKPGSTWQETGTRQIDHLDDLITRLDMRDLLHDFQHLSSRWTLRWLPAMKSAQATDTLATDVNKKIVDIPMVGYSGLTEW